MRFVLLTALVVSVAAVPARANPVQLGNAGGYAGLMYNGSQFTISSGETLITGDVGYGQAGADLDFSGGGTMSGAIYRDLDANSPTISGGSSASGGVQQRDMQPAQNDAESASATAASLTADETFTSIETNTTIDAGADPEYVVDVNDDIALDGETLTLSGNSDTFFILNVDTGGDLAGRPIDFSGGSSITLSGGARSDHVLFNILGSGDRVNSDGDSNTVGTFLAPGRDIVVTGGVHEGSFITGADQLTFQSGPQITEESLVPEPASLTLLAPAGLLLLRRRRRAA